MKFKHFRQFLRFTNDLREKLFYSKKKRPHKDGTLFIGCSSPLVINFNIASVINDVKFDLSTRNL